MLWKFAKRFDQLIMCFSLHFFFCNEKVNKAFSSVLYILHFTFNDAFLIKGKQMMLNPQESAYMRIPSFTGSWNMMSPCSFKRPDRKRSATNVFLSFFWICLLIAIVSLSADSIATHQRRANSEMILNKVPSTTDSPTLFFLEECL